MIKTVKYGLITIVVLPVLLLFALVNFVDLNNYKKTMTTLVKERTGRDMSINGNISWSLFPRLGISINDVTLNNTSGFPQQPFAAVKKVIFSIKLLPLLSRHLDIRKIYVNDLQLNLMINKQGKSNWGDLIQSKASEPKTVKQTPKTASAKKVMPLTNLQIADIKINNADIHLKNLQAQHIMSINNLVLKSHSIAIGKTFPITFSFNFAKKSLTTNQQNLKGSVNYRGKITVHQPTAENATLLSLLELDGDLTTGKLLLNKLHIDSVKAKTKLKNSIFTIKPLTANLYNGIAQSDITVNRQQAVNKYVITTDVNNIQAKSLFNDLAGSQRITGIAQFKSNLTMQGNSQRQLIHSLNGNGQFAFENGRIHGVDVMYLLNWAQAVFEAQTPSQPNSGVTPFGNLTGKVNIRNGVLTNKDLLLQSPQYSIIGSGTANLNNQAINYHLQTKLLNIDPNNKVKKLEEALGGTIPLIISGTFADIKARPDVKTITKARAKTFIKQQIDKFSGQDNSGAGKVAAGVFNKLFN